VVANSLQMIGGERLAANPERIGWQTPLPPVRRASESR
jgi:hypothetical protein